MTTEHTEIAIPVRFVVEDVRFYKPETGFAVVKATFMEYGSDKIPTNDTVITGTFPSVQKKEEFEGEGNWTKHEKHGFRFEVKKVKQVKESLIPVLFEVKRIMHHNADTGFTVAKVKFKEYHSDIVPPTSESIIIGHFMSIFEEDEFEAEGVWTNHETYNFRFELDWAKRVVPQTRKGIQEFIQRFVKGIGKATAMRIVDHFGDDTLAKIDEDWKNLLEIKGLGKKRAIQIHEKISQNRRYEEVALFVLNHGGGYRTALRVYEAFGDSAILKIRENPYVLCGIHKISFPVADTFARNLNFPYNHKERIKNAIVFLLDWCSRARGDLYVSADEIKRTLSKFLVDKGAYKGSEKELMISSTAITDALSELKEAEKIVIELNEEQEQCVYLNNFHFIENRIVTLLKRLLEEPKMAICTNDQIDDFIKEYETNKGFTFAQKQKDSIYMSLRNGISILTGGPGTGKTQTINSIIQCVKTVKPDALIHLMAPTGKASKRMTELTGMEAETIHRKIGLNGFEDEHEMVYVEGDLLVVDESSMVDAYVFYKLLSSITDNTRILFVGDYEQLPSVGAGLILRDLINSNKIPTTKLTEIFRQAQDSQIVMNSHKVIEGKTTAEPNGITFDATKDDFYFIQKNDRIQAQKAIIDTVKRLIQNQGYSFDDIQVLSPMRKGDLGVWNLNRLMQETFNPRELSKNELKVTESFVLREGDKVMQTSNNYDLEVFNGEIGVVTSIFENEDGETCVEVRYAEDKTVVYDHLTVEEIEHAFVITIHKSQGSEYPIVVMPIHSSQENMLNKNLIYTAWTRAKKKVVCIGQRSALDKGVKRSDNTVRNSLIREKIQQQIELK